MEKFPGVPFFFVLQTIDKGVPKDLDFSVLLCEIPYHRTFPIYPRCSETKVRKRMQ